MHTEYSKALAHYFDMLRFSRGLTQEDFVFDIVSVRQYRRYLSGVSKVSQDVIDAFSKKLGLKSEHIILDFERAKIDETKKITAYYNAVVNNDYVGAESMDSKIKTTEIMDENNKKLYLSAVYLKDYRQKKMSEQQIVEHLKRLIDYPEIFNKLKFSSAEIILLSALLGYKSFEDKKTIAERLMTIVSDESQIVSGYNERVRFLCLQRLADYYGSLKEFKVVVNLCAFAIKSLTDIKSYYLMDYFYYFKALAYYYMGDLDHCKESLFRCYAVLQSENNGAKIEKFVKMCFKDMQLDMKTVSLEWLNRDGLSLNHLKN